VARLFVSYRREDSAGFAGRLTDALEHVLGEGSVFRDVDDISPGEDFTRVIQRGLDQVAVVLVVIGPGWLDSQQGGARRLEREDDFVRREIEGALAAGKPLLPVLVGDAQMPPAERLPASIRPLAQRQALALRDASWRSDFNALLEALRPLLAEAGAQAAGAQGGGAGRALARRRHLIAAGVGIIVGLAALIVRPSLNWLRSAPAIDGVWTGRIEYPWGVSVDERFELAVRDGALVGTAGFLGLPRTIEAGTFSDGRLRFTTRSEEVLGSGAPREVIHSYVGELLEDEVRFVLESRGGYSVPPPTRFVVRRR